MLGEGIDLGNSCCSENLGKQTAEGIWNLVKALRKSPRIMSTSKGAGKAPQLMYVVAVSLMSTEPFAQVNDVVLHHTLRLMVLLR